MRTSAGVVASLLVAGTVATAQTTVSIRPVASPGRTTQVSTTQELSITASGVAGAVGKLMMTANGSLTFTQANKARDEQGRLGAELTIQSFEMQRTMNGASEDAGPNATSVSGKQVAATFDAAGKLVDLRIPTEIQSSAGSIRQLLGGAYGVLNGLPEAPMQVGETRSLDISTLPVRLPGSTATVKPLASVTLRALDVVNGDRIARLTQRVQSVSPADQLAVHGTGTIDVNIDKGFVTTSTMDWTFAGALPGAAGLSATEPPRVEATFKMTLSASE